MRGLALLFAALLALPLRAAPPAAPASQAGPPGLVTIVDGDGAVLLRQSVRLVLAEGVRLFAGDIVQTGAATRLLRLELADGLLLDLGPATRLQLAPRLAGSEAARQTARLYLLDGWLKLSATRALPDVVWLASPALDLRAPQRSAVLALDAGGVALFAESGTIAAIPRQGGRAGAAVTLKAGEFYTRRGAAPATTAPRPAPAWVGKLPKAFLDTLPERAARFAEQPVVPRPLGAPTWDDVQPWIDAEPALRPGFVTRWRALALQPEFRQRLQDTLAAHPEWDPVLNPDKYRAIPASAPAASSVSPGSSALPVR